MARKHKAAKRGDGLDGRHRDATGRIDKTHGNIRIGSLHAYLRKYHK